jgi:hypothetical protein
MYLPLFCAIFLHLVKFSSSPLPLIVYTRSYDVHYDKPSLRQASQASQATAMISQQYHRAISGLRFDNFFTFFIILLLLTRTTSESSTLRSNLPWYKSGVRIEMLHYDAKAFSRRENSFTCHRLNSSPSARASNLCFPFFVIHLYWPT